MIFKTRLASLCRWLKDKSLFIYYGVAPVILLCSLLSTCNFGCNIIVNGEVIGTAPSKEYVYSLIENINNEFSPYLSGNKAINVDPLTTPKLLIGKGFTDTQKLEETLKSYCPYLEKAYTVKSNGKTIVGFKSKNERKSAYDTFISEMTKGSASFELADEITFEHELVPYGLIKSGKQAVKMLGRTYEFNDTVTLDSKTKLSEILTKYSISESEFAKLNPKYKSGIAGKVKIKSDVPYIRVITAQSYTEKTLVKYSVKYEMDSTLPEGTSKLKTDGKDGIRKVTKTIYAVNGNNVYTHSNQPVLENAETRIVLVGTKEVPKGKTTGSFGKPSDGVLSSRFGTRNGRKHKGVDISGPINSDIYAADGGKVTFAGWDNSGYGNMIKIEHDNGYTTLYAHCNKLFVSDGDYVARGDVIAALGNTGRTTGPHVHFEVIVTESGNVVDPLEVFDIPITE